MLCVPSPRNPPVAVKGRHVELDYDYTRMWRAAGRIAAYGQRPEDCSGRTSKGGGVDPRRVDGRLLPPHFVFDASQLQLAQRTIECQSQADVKIV